MENKKDLKNYSLETLRELLQSIGHKPFNANQLFQWIFRHLEDDFSNMSNLSKNLRQDLQEKFNIEPLKILEVITSKDGTQKYLFELSDGNTIESVLIPDIKRVTLCISSQVGCKIGCSFCATGAIGFKRNLSTHEIVSQLWTVDKSLVGQDLKRVSNVVFMGMGEPLDNLQDVIKAWKIFTDDQGFGISKRKAIISTCGLVDKFDTLLEQTKANLAISLHSPFDDIRNTLVPINKRFNLESLFKACHNYQRITKKPITFEYTLIDGINDRPQDARTLAKYLSQISCKINLIPYNSHKFADYKPSTIKNVRVFQTTLLNKGIRALLRTPRGNDIIAACGQLTGNYQKN